MAKDKYGALNEKRIEKRMPLYKRKLDVAAVKAGRKGEVKEGTLREGFFSTIAKADKERIKHHYKSALKDYLAASSFALEEEDVELLEMVDKRVYRLAKQIDDEDSKHKYADIEDGLIRGESLYNSASNLGKEIESDLKKLKGVRTKKAGTLEKTAATVAVIGILGGIFFLSPNITGNVIGNSSSTGNMAGIVLFVLGLVGALFYFKRKKITN